MYIYIICVYIYTYVASDIFWNVFVEEHLAFSGIYLGFLILGYIKEEFDFSMKWKFE